METPKRFRLLPRLLAVLHKLMDLLLKTTPIYLTEHGEDKLVAH